ncbi:hypothetical protein [Gloeothece verrucosa]|uniref:Uncharacterized protein n=1 Tax=Gloeothece verrucosa (strain PCC 7822) TaxID=497965 RepID=E0UJ68_GLOV7|nr:hypothetical protein [Gloeothece verrucosa]ADN15771.1 hypothetical protein Cyan7822_3839 [Gloeothece verrucosa PCC 7822]
MTEETMMIPVPKFAKGDSARLGCMKIERTLFDNDTKEWIYSLSQSNMFVPEDLLHPAPKGGETND